MTDEPEELEPLPVIDDCDPFLQLFADMVDGTSGSMALTLSVNGSVVTGMLVSRDAWMERYVQEHSRYGEESADFAETVRSLLDRSIGRRPEPAPENFGLLHLTEAQIVQGESLVPFSRDGLWRVRIPRVDAWAPGRLSASEE